MDDNVGMAPEPTFTVKKLIAMTPTMADAVNAYRFDARIVSEAEATRRLIQIGLDAAAAASEAPAKTSASKRPLSRGRR